jgi:hypothetical protein
MKSKDQGVNAESVFHGESKTEASSLIYKESAPFLSGIISKNLLIGNYKLADLGSHKGEFLQDLVRLLPYYNFDTLAVDINQNDLELNPANKKLLSDLSALDIPNKSIDVTIARYALAWNLIEAQRQILAEIKRTTTKIAIIQHQGSKNEYPNKLQNASENLFGGVVPVLKRDVFCFSTSEQIEIFMKELGINFERLQDREVKGLSDIFVEKYSLSEEDALKVKSILSESDYVRQTTWILKF